MPDYFSFRGASQTASEVTSMVEGACGPPSSGSNPFATPTGSRAHSRAPSTIGTASGFAYADIPGSKYFKSRRIIKGENPLPKRKKKPVERLLWMLPVTGFFLGLCLTGLMIYLKLSQNATHNYCPVLSDDFSSGTLDPKIWTKEVESGGYGNQQFEQTTASEDVIFIKDGKLTIKPKLQDEKLLTSNNVINLLADGTCTSTTWADCVSSTNTTNGTIIQPVLSGRINTKLRARIKYGRVEVSAKIAKGDWLWPAIWMLPVTETYGAWPRSGEIDILESRGNNYTYSMGGNNIAFSALHWGPNAKNDGYKLTSNNKPALHSQLGDKFHVYGLEWSEKYLVTYMDNVLRQVMYFPFTSPLYPQGYFPNSDSNGTVLSNPWAGTGRTNSPFDQEFYLIINVAVGGQNGWFRDGSDGKPWVDSSSSAKKDFWEKRGEWYPTWQGNGRGEMVVDSVKMWQQC